jgi:hypothetical protein
MSAGVISLMTINGDVAQQALGADISRGARAA